MEEQGLTKEKIQGIIIAILSAIIIFGGAYFVSELKYCEVKETVSLSEIGINEFTTLLNDEAASIIYIARPGCGFCKQQEPIMKQVATEYDLIVHYLNTDELTTDNMVYLLGLDKKLFGEDGKKFGTPTTLIVQKGKIVEGSIGLMSNTELVNFFTKHGFIK